MMIRWLCYRAAADYERVVGILAATPPAHAIGTDGEILRQQALHEHEHEAEEMPRDGRYWIAFTAALEGVRVARRLYATAARRRAALEAANRERQALAHPWYRKPRSGARGAPGGPQ